MAASASVYRALLRLYPSDFRSTYGDDLRQVFTDLVDRDGAASAWRRTVVDLAVTVPRYRLETVMSSRRSTTAVVAIVALLGGGAVLVGAAGFGLPAALLLVLAVAVAVAERSQLARSLRAENTAHRRRRWLSSAGCALVALAVVAIAMVDLGGRDHWPVGRVLIYNVAFFAAVIAALAMFVGGLRRPRIT